MAFRCTVMLTSGHLFSRSRMWPWKITLPETKKIIGARVSSFCCRQTIHKCQVRCTGVLPYHTCPHHLHWRWYSCLRSVRASPWSCCRAGRSGLASGSGRQGSSCGSQCKTWNQQSSAGPPVGSSGRKQKQKKYRKKGKDRWFEIRTAQVLIVTCAVAFFYWRCFRKMVLQGLKTAWLWYLMFFFLVLRGTFIHCAFTSC